MPAIQWYPGHMAKTTRILKENIKHIDVVIEVMDARIPSSSENPDFHKLVAGRRRLVLLNKEDLADPSVSLLWKEHFAKSNVKVIFSNLKTGGGLKTVKDVLKKIGEDKIARHASKGVVHRPVRAMVVGIPNSGKSTLINQLAGRASTKTADRPGVTRSKQWVRIGGGIDLLDTPGILWPKFENQQVALNLAFTGAIKDAITDVVEVADTLLQWINENYPDCLANRYKLSDDILLHGSLLGAVAKRRSFLLPGGEVDMNRAATIVLDEFRAAKIGRISLESPPPEEGATAQMDEQ